jgi:hypothetical protein
MESKMKIIAYVGAGLFIVFGALFFLAAFSPTNQASTGGTMFTGLILVAIGFGLIFFASRKSKTAGGDTTNVTYKIDLPGNVSMDTIKCKSCGGTIASENIAMVAGAPMVTCPYCHTSYQLTEEPKW